MTLPPTPFSLVDESKIRAKFLGRLTETVTEAKKRDYTALWAEVPMSESRIIPYLGERGFRFHRAEGDTSHLFLWLKEGEECRVPDYATHQVGVGGMCISPCGTKILVVRELRGNFAKWKIPGGLSDVGEGLSQAACREVLEETGVECEEGGTVLSFRHTHGSQFGRSDLYFVVRLKPKVDENGELPTPVPQAGEISEALWLPLSTFKESVSPSSSTPHPVMQRVLQVMEQKGGQGEGDIQMNMIESIVPGRNPSPVYHPPLTDE